MMSCRISNRHKLICPQKFLVSNFAWTLCSKAKPNTPLRNVGLWGALRIPSPKPQRTSCTQWLAEHSEPQFPQGCTAAFFISEDNNDHFTVDLMWTKWDGVQNTLRHSFVWRCSPTKTSAPLHVRSFILKLRKLKARPVTSKVKAETKCDILHLLHCFRQMAALKTVLTLVWLSSLWKTTVRRCIAWSPSLEVFMEEAGITGTAKVLRARRGTWSLKPLIFSSVKGTRVIPTSYRYS